MNTKEYGTFKLETENDGRISVYNRFSQYITTVDSEENAKEFIKENSEKIRKEIE